MITDKQIQEVLEDFDFVKVAKIYKYMKWEWVTLKGDGIPKEKDLRKKAVSHLNELKKKYPKTSSISSGGLCVSAHEEEGLYTIVTLEFIAHTAIA